MFRRNGTMEVNPQKAIVAEDPMAKIDLPSALVDGGVCFEDFSRVVEEFVIWLDLIAFLPDLDEGGGEMGDKCIDRWMMPRIISSVLLCVPYSRA